MEKIETSTLIILIIMLIWQWSNINSLKDKIQTCSKYIDSQNLEITDISQRAQTAYNLPYGSSYQELLKATKNLAYYESQTYNPCK